MLNPSNTYNQVPFTSQMQYGVNPEQLPINGAMGNPQTESYANGGRTKKRYGMIEVFVSKPEIEEMIEAQGGPEYDRVTGRHMFKKLGKILENPHIERAIRAKFAQGGGMNSLREGMQEHSNRPMYLNMNLHDKNKYAHGGAIQHRSPIGTERYARGGDTDLVYITPRMQRLFDETGRGSINPVTGNREYFGLSDIWSGIKNFGSSVLSGLNSVAPALAEAARPLAAKLPGAYGLAANAALDMAPNLLNQLNNSVNSVNNQNPNQNPDWRNLVPQMGAHIANDISSRYNSPMARGVQAGAQSYLNNQNFGQGAANAFNAATSHMPNNPFMDTMRAGADTMAERGDFGQGLQAMGQRASSYLPQMANNVANRVGNYAQSLAQKYIPSGNAGMDRQRMESQLLDSIYKPGYAAR